MRFLLIDRIDRLELGRRAEGHKFISPDEPYFRDHFPGYPIVPGVLLIESLAQLGGRLIEATVRASSGRSTLAMLAKIENARLLKPVGPGVRLDLAVDSLGIGSGAARVKGVARVEGERVATAGIMYALVDPDLALTPPQAAELLKFSRETWRALGPAEYVESLTDGGDAD